MPVEDARIGPARRVVPDGGQPVIGVCHLDNRVGPGRGAFGQKLDPAGKGHALGLGVEPKRVGGENIVSHDRVFREFERWRVFVIGLVHEREPDARRALEFGVEIGAGHLSVVGDVGQGFELADLIVARGTGHVKPDAPPGGGLALCDCVKDGEQKLRLPVAGFERADEPKYDLFDRLLRGARGTRGQRVIAQIDQVLGAKDPQVVGLDSPWIACEHIGAGLHRSVKPEFPLRTRAFGKVYRPVIHHDPRGRAEDHQPDPDQHQQNGVLLPVEDVEHVDVLGPAFACDPCGVAQPRAAPFEPEKTRALARLDVKLVAREISDVDLLYMRALNGEAREDIGCVCTGISQHEAGQVHHPHRRATYGTGAGP